MAAGEPVEPGSRQMKPTQQIDATRPHIDDRLLSLTHLKKGEGGAATPETVADEHHRAFGARQHLAIEPAYLSEDRCTLRYQPINLTRDLNTDHGDFGFGRLRVGLGAKHIAPVGGAAAKWDRPANDERYVITVAEMTHSDASGRISDIRRLGQSKPRPSRVALSREQSEIRAGLGLRPCRARRIE